MNQRAAICDLGWGGSRTADPSLVLPLGWQWNCHPNFLHLSPYQPVEKRRLKDFECHRLRQCREIRGNTALAKPVAHFFNGLLA
jgi:hypothetical protein